MEENLLDVIPEVHCTAEIVPIETVVPNPLNPNTHPREQLDMMAEILRAHGWREPITISKRSGKVVRGHGRLMAALAMGLKDVPVQFQDYTSDEKELADLIADNRIAQHSFVDALALGKVLHRIGDQSRRTTGYSEEETGLLLAAEYVPPKPTDFNVVPMERLACTRDEKTIIVGAIQKWCLRAGKELKPGEVVAKICQEWETKCIS